MATKRLLLTQFIEIMNSGSPCVFYAYVPAKKYKQVLELEAYIKDEYPLYRIDYSCGDQLFGGIKKGGINVVVGTAYVVLPFSCRNKLLTELRTYAPSAVQFH